MGVVRHTHIFTPPFWPGNQVLAKFPLLLTTSHLSTAAQYGYAPQDIPPVTVSFAQPRKGPPFRCSLVYPRLSIRTPCQAMPCHGVHGVHGWARRPLDHPIHATTGATGRYYYILSQPDRHPGECLACRHCRYRRRLRVLPVESHQNQLAYGQGGSIPTYLTSLGDCCVCVRCVALRYSSKVLLAV
ncbi:hypothetical protein K456DRAFT_111697 [Colletotrichum gloeosporioides 23]|nr:hypothetical protein K456DRAFT_111697 [Colletotrichum gloeosporioides 23]